MAFLETAVYGSGELYIILRRVLYFILTFYFSVFYNTVQQHHKLTTASKMT